MLEVRLRGQAQGYGPAAPRARTVRTPAHDAVDPSPSIQVLRVRAGLADTSKAAPERAKISRGGLVRALAAPALDHLSVSRIAAEVGVWWSAANAAILAEGKRRLIDDPHRFDGVTTIGVEPSRVWFGEYLDRSAPLNIAVERHSIAIRCQLILPVSASRWRRRSPAAFRWLWGSSRTRVWSVERVVGRIGVEVSLRMEVPTLTIRKTSTCSTLPSPRPASPRSAASTSSASKPSGS